MNKWTERNEWMNLCLLSGARHDVLELMGATSTGTFERTERANDSIIFFSFIIFLFKDIFSISKDMMF